MDKTKTKKVLNIISNVFFAIVMVFLVIFMVYGFGSISQDKVPSFFGQSYMWIQSGSMSDPVNTDPYDEESELISDGFEVGEVVVIQQVNTSTIQVGDIIAFYTGSPSSSNLTPIEEADAESILSIDASASRYSGSRTFHQVIDIEVDGEGYIYFTTKGSHNSSPDGTKVRADYVIGVYTPSALAGVLQFISSSTGIIVLVVVPSCIVLFLLLLSIIDTVDKMIKKKKEEEAFQDALVRSISSGNATTTQPEIKTSSYGGLTESSMAGFEREMAKLEAKNKGKTDETKNASDNDSSTDKVETKDKTIAEKENRTKTVEDKKADAKDETKKVPTKPAINKNTSGSSQTTVKAESKVDEKTTAKTETNSSKTDNKEDKNATKAEGKSSTKKEETKAKADSKSTTKKDS